MDMDGIHHYLRLLNVLIAGLVLGLCFLKVNWDRENKARNTRIIGLAIICLVIAWGSFARRNEVFNIRTPILTVGLAFCLFGMRLQALGENLNKRK